MLSHPAFNLVLLCFLVILETDLNLQVFGNSLGLDSFGLRLMRRRLVDWTGTRELSLPCESVVDLLAFD